MATPEAKVALARAAMAAGFGKFVEDPGCLEGIYYVNYRSKAAFLSIEGVGMIETSQKQLHRIIQAEDYGMALMIWKGEEQMEKRRTGGQALVLNGYWDALAQELKDLIIECSISARSPDVRIRPSSLSGCDVLRRPYREDAIYHGAPAAFFQHSRLHFYVRDLDFAPVIEVLSGCTRQARAGMLQNGRLAIYLVFSETYSHVAHAVRIWTWVEFCVGVEKELGGRRVPWRYLADENDDVLHAELESLVCKALDGAGMPAELREIVESMQQAPLAAFT